jgi:23S rRNA pseudouridine1911/1915/1917 synthase
VSRGRDLGRSAAIPDGGRADRVVAEALGVGRRRAREMIESGVVLVDGRRARCGEKLEATAAITVAEPVVPHERELPPQLPRIVWEGGHVIGVNKPAGYHSHRGKQSPSIADFLAETHPGIEEVGNSAVECGLVHRLDRDTSGILVAASDPKVFLALRTAFGNGEISKDYLALVHGVLASETVVDVALARLHSRVRAARRAERSWAARTRVMPLEHGNAWTLVMATMETGVTHQIRAHLAILGHPVIGDRKYGNAGNHHDAAGGQRLHAWCIRLPGGLTLAAAPDGRFLETLAQLRAGRTFA